MRISKVPIDMASEQKNILGMLSSRQAIYLGIGGALLYAYIPAVFMFLFHVANWLIAIFISALLAIPVIAIIGYFGFLKVEKLNMNRDYYMYIKLQRNTQYGSWRKGR